MSDTTLMIRQVKLGEKVKTGPKSGYIKQHPVGGWHLVDGEDVKGAPAPTRCGKQMVWTDDLIYHIMRHSQPLPRVRIVGSDFKHPKTRPIKNDELCPECFTSCGSPKL
jgi:hypothetical protein